MLVYPVTRMLRIPATRDAFMIYWLLWATAPLFLLYTVLSRSMFKARPRDISRPNWFAVTLAFGTSAALWGLLITQHNEDVAEYKKRNGLE